MENQTTKTDTASAIPAVPPPASGSGKICQKCGDRMRGHEDESGTQCRWCVTGWETCADDCQDAASV